MWKSGQMIAHIGSAHTPGELAALIEIAKQRINADQHELDLGLDDRASAVIDLPASSAAVVKRSSSRILWQGLAGSYERLGLGVVADSVAEYEDTEARNKAMAVLGAVAAAETVRRYGDDR